MKKVFFVILVVALCITVFIYIKVQKTNLSGPAIEISLRISGSNDIGSVGWSGQHTSPVTYDFSYKDITHISVKLFDPILINKVGSNQDDYMEYGLKNKHNTVYVLLTQKDGDSWYTPDFVTDNVEKVIGKTFIKGSINGGSGPYAYNDKTIFLDMTYDGIQNSQDIIPFVDLFAMHWRIPGDVVIAKVLVDHQGNTALSEVMVNGKVCITKNKTDLDDKECWNDFRLQRQDQKKYSLTFLPLLFRKLRGN